MVATDEDGSTQELRFSLREPVPPGAEITSEGDFSWLPDESFGGTTNLVTIVVTDDNDPPASSSETIAIVVEEGNDAPGPTDH